MIMKHLQLIFAALLGLLALPQASFAQSAAAAPAALPKGKVQAMLVVGDVELTTSDGKTAPLKRGQIFEDGSSVYANKGANALLVLSNGATLKVKENTKLDVNTFEQAPFDEQAEGTFLRLSKDPSKSTTDLKLSDGSLQGEVKKLDTSDGSKFTVQTPGGSAGIRGTIIDITIVRDAQGRITGVIANCITGNVAFTPTAGSVSGQGVKYNNQNVDSATIQQGGSMQITFSVDPVTGQISGGTMSATNISISDLQTTANQLQQSVNDARVQEGLPPVPAASISQTNSGGVVVSQGGTVTPITPTTNTNNNNNSSSQQISNPSNLTGSSSSASSSGTSAQ